MEEKLFNYSSFKKTLKVFVRYREEGSNSEKMVFGKLKQFLWMFLVLCLLDLPFQIKEERYGQNQSPRCILWKGFTKRGHHRRCFPKTFAKFFRTRHIWPMWNAAFVNFWFSYVYTALHLMEPKPPQSVFVLYYIEQ